MKDYFINSGILERYHEMPLNDKVNTMLKQDFTRSYWVLGENGVGKTTLMTLVFREKIKENTKEIPENRVRGFLITSTDMLMEALVSKKLDKFLSVGVLGIDDVGDFYFNSENTKELASVVLNKVCRYRYDRNLPTWVTSDIGKEILSKNLNKRFVSFIDEAFIGVKLSNPSFRPKMKKIIEL